MSLAGSEFELFWNERSKWSEETFGPRTSRGAIGPLKHLKKEVEEMLENPTDLEEFADGLFLLTDAAFRAGFTYREFMDMLWYKLEKNKKRVWGPPSADGVVEHVKGIHD